MVEINWTELAVQDLKDIYDYIAQDSEKFALLTVNKFYFEADYLKDFPKIGRIVPEFKSSAIRERIIGNYRLIYFVKSKSEVVILRVYSSWRKLSKGKLK